MEAKRRERREVTLFANNIYDILVWRTSVFEFETSGDGDDENVDHNEVFKVICRHAILVDPP